MSCIAKMNRNLSRCRYHPDNTHRCIRRSLHTDDHRCFCGEVFKSPTGLESMMGVTRPRLDLPSRICQVDTPHGPVSPPPSTATKPQPPEVESDRPDRR